MVESDCNRDLALKYSATQSQGTFGRRTAVAVLDTGFDAESVFFTRPRRQRVKGWKDFAENREEPCDDSGHGTSVLSVLMKVAPYADVYVARVAKSIEDLPRASNNIAEVGYLTSNCDISLTPSFRPFCGQSQNGMSTSCPCLLVSKARSSLAVHP